MINEGAKSVDGILLIYHHPLAANAPTIMDHVNAFGHHSRFRVWTVNTELGFPKFLEELRFRIIVLHYSIFGPWVGARPFLLPEEFWNYLKESASSYKVAFFQDEFHYCQKRFEFLNHHQLDCVYTLVEEAYFKDFYQKYTNVPKLINYIPGHVSKELTAVANVLTVPEDKRTIDIGYRARRLAYYMGRGAQEKTEIALGFAARAKGLGLKLDLGTEEEQRIYGTDWYRFLANCRAVLGVEAGVSFTDTEDVVRTEHERLMAANPNLTFQEFWDAVLHKWDGQIPQRVISPRHFEAAALRVCQILFEGNYSGVMQPLVHYIPLKKDFSNFDDVIRMFHDRALRRELTENAYRDLIASGKYSYDSFIKSFDEQLMQEGLVPGVPESDVAAITLRLRREERYLRFRAKKNAVLYHKVFPGRDALAFTARPVLKLFRKLRTMGQPRHAPAFSKEKD
jgi:hypothetical protein